MVTSWTIGEYCNAYSANGNHRTIETILFNVWPVRWDYSTDLCSSQLILPFRYVSSSGFYRQWQNICRQLWYIALHSFGECFPASWRFPAFRMWFGCVPFVYDWRRLTFVFMLGFMLVGNRGSTCFSGIWRPDQLPICIEGNQSCRRHPLSWIDVNLFRSACFFTTHPAQICQ